MQLKSRKAGAGKNAKHAVLQALGWSEDSAVIMIDNKPVTLKDADAHANLDAQNWSAGARRELFDRGCDRLIASNLVRASTMPWFTLL